MTLIGLLGFDIDIVKMYLEHTRMLKLNTLEYVRILQK